MYVMYKTEKNINTALTDRLHTNLLIKLDVIKQELNEAEYFLLYSVLILADEIVNTLKLATALLELNFSIIFAICKDYIINIKFFSIFNG